MANKTGLVLTGTPLPPDWAGTPQEFFEAILARIQIEAPFGFTSFVVGSNKPTSNQGPWLKDGRTWYVWDDDEADYVPADIADSMPSVYWIQDATPSSLTPPVWFKTSGSNFVEVYVAVNGVWTPLGMQSGTTANRPSNPVDFQKYYDTDISALIWWERGQWRTVSGVRGDVKHVIFETATEALAKNPGWEILGTGTTDNTTWRGRVIGQATKDAGGAASTDLTVGGGITKRAARDAFGSETHTLSTAEMPAHTHNVPGVILNTSGSAVGSGGSYGAGSRSTSSTGGGEAHNNLQPTLSLWTLCKT